MAITPDGLEENRKWAEKYAHNWLTVEMDKWFTWKITTAYELGKELPYVISWGSAWAAVDRKKLNTISMYGVRISQPSIIRAAMDNFDHAGWKVTREHGTKGWWIFKFNTDDILFDKLEPEEEPCHSTE